MKLTGAIAFVLALFAFPALSAENCVSAENMDDLALVNDATIVATMKGKAHKRVDLHQCAGLTKSREFTFTASDFCPGAALPVAQAPAGCTVQKIVDIAPADATALLTPAASYDDIAREAKARKADQERKRTAVAFDPAAFDKFLGYYQIDLDAFVEVTRKDKKYFYRTTTEKAVEVFPESGTKFFAKSTPAQISFAPGSHLTLHRNGEEIVARRVDDAMAKSSEAAVYRRMVELTPDPEREALLRRYLIAAQAGDVPADILSAPLLAYTRQQWPAIQETNRQMGKWLVLRFAGFGPNGEDMFRAHYEHGAITWMVGSLTTDHKLLALAGAKNKADCPARCGCSETTISVKDTWKGIALVEEGDEILIKTQKRWTSSIVDAPPPVPGARQSSDPEVWAKLGGGGGRDALAAAAEEAATAVNQPTQSMLIDPSALDEGSPIGVDAVLGRIGNAQHFAVDPGTVEGRSFATGTLFSRIAERSGPLFIVKNNSRQPRAREDKTAVQLRVCYRGDVTVLPLGAN